MAALQFESLGRLIKQGDTWLIELASHPAGLEAGSNVGLVFWDRRKEGERSEFEEIARVQQLEIPVVSHGLQAEGAIRSNANEFLERLKQEWA
jgi:hypothetical protein